MAQITRSTYDYGVKTWERLDSDAHIKDRIKTIYHEHKGQYRYRRIRDQLHKDGHQVNRKKGQRIMKERELTCIVRMKKYRSYKGNVGKVSPNWLNRNFSATKPNEKWTTDITEFKRFGEKLCSSPLLDLFKGERMTYTLKSRPIYALVSK